MIRVLEDLQSYARIHGIHTLADHLDQARLLAITECASLPPDDEVIEPHQARFKG